MSIGKAIIYLREVYELTQLELAEKLGINKSVLSRIEAETRPVRDDELIKIADFFDISADYLLGRKEVSNLLISKQRLARRDMEILKGYRSAPDAIKKIIDTALEPYMKKKDAPSEQEAV